jgi:hypothetical protein
MNRFTNFTENLGLSIDRSYGLFKLIFRIIEFFLNV